MTLRDEYFEQRKQDKIEEARKAVQQAKEKAQESESAADNGLTDNDIWLARKNETSENDNGDATESK